MDKTLQRVREDVLTGLGERLTQCGLSCFAFLLHGVAARTSLEVNDLLSLLGQSGK